MRRLSTGVLFASLWFGLNGSTWGEEDGIDFRKDICVRHAGGYHTYRIPVVGSLTSFHLTLAVYPA